jgi:type II secretory pathway pseudopilin PulG
MCYPGKNRWVELRLYWACMLPFMLKPTHWVQAQALRWLGWLPKPCHTRSALGFTLAEVLISLLILAEIATFTIPKIITAQQSNSSNARAREAVAMIASAFQLYQINNQVSATTGPADLTQYMNYISVQTTGLVDAEVGAGSYDCANVGFTCLKLHNGGVLHYSTSAIHFDTLQTTAAIYYFFDPDGAYSGSTSDSPSKAILFFLYPNGRITSWDKCASNTRGGYYPNGGADPSWFRW